MTTKWVVFSYSLPSKSGSAARVALWRRLQRLGAVSPTSGTFVLPAKADLVEAFQWLAQEVQGENGQALVMHVDDFEGISEQELISLFHQARQEDYHQLDQELEHIAAQLAGDASADQHLKLAGKLTKLDHRQAEIAQIDYFNSPEGQTLAARIKRLRAQLRPDGKAVEPVASASTQAYSGRTWVTRPRPHVDRLACVWLIRRFLDPDAVIRYANQAKRGEITFDMLDAEFGHRGNLCTFEVLAQAFAMTDPAIQALGEIVHEIDLRDGRFQRPEVSGVDSVLRGWLAADLADEELEARGIQFFDGLFESLGRQAAE